MLRLIQQTGQLSDLLPRAISAVGRGQIQILRRRSEEVVTLTTDLDRLTQVFINLIANAEKYCDAANPELRIEVTRTARAVTVDFIDNGRGIDQESQQVIFEKFSRLSDHRKAGGAGLGLAICREIMARLEGAITYVPGQGGAAFRVTLPRKDA